MAAKKGPGNARRIYRQQVLSGWERVNQPENTNSGSETPRSGNETPQDITGKKYYQVLIPVIIETVGASDLEYNIRIHLNANADLLISPYSLGSKKAVEPTIAVPRENGEKVSKVHMVYGIHTSGMYSLSYPIGHKPQQGIAEFYSFLLGKIDDALQRALLKPEKQKVNDDARERVKSSPTPKNLGTNKAKGRREKVHPEIQPETLSETSTGMDETNGEVLGNG